jgi:hypothetical protein
VVFEEIEKDCGNEERGKTSHNKSVNVKRFYENYACPYSIEYSKAPINN